MTSPTPTPAPPAAASAAATPAAAVANPISGHWRIALLLLVLSLVLYANSLRNGFVFDDRSTLLKNEAIRSFSTLPELFTRSPTRNYRPVRYLAFAPDFALFGEDPWGFHLLNVIYHGGVAWLVFLVLRRLAKDDRVALAGALLFTVHPVHTEVVGYISGRRDLAFTGPYLLALLSFFRWRDGGRIGWLAAAGGLFGLAIGAKEMAATFPAVILLHDALLDRPALRRALPIYAAGGAVLAAAIWHAIDNGTSGKGDWWGGSAAANFMTVARIWVHYGKLLVAPITLVADYSTDAFPLSRSLFEARTLGAIAVLVALAGVAIACVRRAPLVALGICWIGVTLLPVSHIIPFHELMAEHHLYLPSIGLCLLAGLGVERARARFGARAAYFGFAVVLALFSARTVVRNYDWYSSETLNRSILVGAPDCARAHLNLGLSLAARNDLANALAEQRLAVKLDPDFIFGHMSLARLYARLGKGKEAREHGEKALALASAMERPPLYPGDILVELGRYAEAIGFYEVQLKRRKNVVQSLFGLGKAHDLLGNSETALDWWERYLRVEPTNVSVARRAVEVAKKIGDRRLGAFEAHYEALMARRRALGYRS